MGLEMNVSQKCQYALRAVFELARRGRDAPVKIADIAQAQAIPIRFLEVILSELKHGGFVESRRGANGGYLLGTAPKDITAGSIIEYVDGPLAPVRCVATGEVSDCPLRGACSFMDLWERARDAVREVYNSVTLQELLDNDKTIGQQYATDYCI